MFESVFQLMVVIAVAWLAFALLSSLFWLIVRALSLIEDVLRKWFEE